MPWDMNRVLCSSASHGRLSDVGSAGLDLAGEGRVPWRDAARCSMKWAARAEVRRGYYDYDESASHASPITEKLLKDLWAKKAYPGTIPEQETWSARSIHIT